MKKAICTVRVDGRDISSALDPVLIDVKVNDSAGKTSGTASLAIDDTDGRTIFPAVGATLTIALGWQGDGVDLVFNGFVDEVKSSGDRGGGRKLAVSASEVDTRGKAKQGQHRHWDNANIKTILSDAGKDAGVDEIKIEGDLADVELPYEAMRGESFIAFGQRLARQVGGTFKVVGTRAVLIPRNGDGVEFPTIRAEWGVNLHSWDVTPTIGRAANRGATSRFYDRESAVWRETSTETDDDSVETYLDTPYTEPDEGAGKRSSQSKARASDRGSADGSVTIEGNAAVQPEAILEIVGARPGVDGPYRIDSVEHSYSRGGWTTRVSLGRPDKKKAGKDKRRSSSDVSDEYETFLDAPDP